jgi:hypothetical protein
LNFTESHLIIASKIPLSRTSQKQAIFVFFLDNCLENFTPKVRFALFYLYLCLADFFFFLLAKAQALDKTDKKQYNTITDENKAQQLQRIIS